MAMEFVETVISNDPYKKEVKLSYRAADVAEEKDIVAACGIDTDTYSIGSGKKANVRIDIIIMEEDA